MKKKDAIKLIDAKIFQFQKILDDATYDNRNSEEYKFAYYGTEKLLEKLFSENEMKNFRNTVNISYGVWNDGIDYVNYEKELQNYKNHIERCISQLKVYIENIDGFGDENISTSNSTIINKWKEIEAWAKDKPLLLGLFLLILSVIISYFVFYSPYSPYSDSLKVATDHQIAFLPGNFEIDLSKDYSPITMVEIKVEANNGEITLLRESELLEQKIDEYPFDELVFHMSNIEILSLEPKDAIIGENKNSSIIIIKFDSSKLLPLGNYRFDFRKGDVVKFGDLKVRLFYKSNNDVVFEDIVIPMYLTKE